MAKSSTSAKKVPTQEVLTMTENFRTAFVWKKHGIEIDLLRGKRFIVGGKGTMPINNITGVVSKKHAEELVTAGKATVATEPIVEA